MVINGHMPFYFTNLEGREGLLFCKGKKKKSSYGNQNYLYVSYKTHIVWLDDPNNQIAFNTTFNNRAIECNPYYYTDGNKDYYTISITNNISGTNQEYKLYKIEDNKASEIDIWNYPVFNGCYNNSSWVICMKEFFVNYDKNSDKVFWCKTSFDLVNRVIYCLNSEKIIVTGRINNATKSIIYDHKKGVVDGELLADNKSIYKCTYEKGRLFYADGLSINRRIKEGKASVGSTDITVKRVEKETGKIDNFWEKITKEFN